MAYRCVNYLVEQKMYESDQRRHLFRIRNVAPTSKTNAKSSIDNKPFPPRFHVTHNKKLKYERDRKIIYN